MENPIPRPGVRVLLIDTDGKTLLFGSVNDAGGRFWFPPGGGVEPGENVLSAAIRELGEETGRDGITLEAEIGFRRHRAMWRDTLYEFQEFWYLARTEPFDIDTDGFTDDETRSIDDHRWWTLDELDCTEDELVPRKLAELVSTLLTDGPPVTPFDLGV